MPYIAIKCYPKDEETKKAINILKLMNTETQTYKKDKERVLLASWKL